MTADDMEKMAEHAEHMGDWYFDRLGKIDGPAEIANEEAYQAWRESARYWREQRGKADLR